MITTKMQPPHLRGKFVARARLLRLLDVATESRLTIVSSPAGFGKSTLLTHWTTTVREGKVAWLSLDKLDNNLARFLKYLAGALQRADPTIAENAESLIDSSPVTPVESLLTVIINDLSRAGAPIFLVLDDAHLLVSGEIAGFLNALVAYAPPALRIILSTRGELPAELASMKMKGQVVSIGDGDLRFSLEESEDYLRNACGLTLATSAVVTLHRKTEGWPAGLQLAALALAHEGSKDRFIAEFSGTQRDIATLLAHEVLARQPAEIQEFLLRTSVLDRFCLPLARAVCPSLDCTAALAEVERSNLFLIALDTTGHWFRYHHLFSEFLRDRLEAQAPQETARLHAAAAAWLAENGHVSDAVGHALASGDKDFAARLVEECAMPLIMQGHIPRLTEWLDQLPDDLIAERPRLLLARVWAQFHMSRPRQAVRFLKQAKELIETMAVDGRLDRAAMRSLKAELQTLTAGVISASDRSRSATRVAAQWLADFPEDEPFARGTLANIAAFSHYSLGELDASRLLSLKARDYHAASNSVFGIVYCDLLLGLVEISAGSLTRAQEYLDRACRLAHERLGPSSYAEAMTAIFNVELAYEWNDLQRAERILHQHRQVIEECGLVVHEMACKLHLARLAAAEGRHDDAILFLERAERLGIEKRYRRLTASALNDRVRLLLSRGNVRAARLALRSRGIEVSPEERTIHPMDEYAHIGAARVLIAEDKPLQAVAILDRIALRMRNDGRMRGFMQVRALLAIAAYQAGDALQALAAMVDAITLAQQQNAIRSLIDEGPAMRLVLEFARERIPAWTRNSETATFVDTLLREFGRNGVDRGRAAVITRPGKRQTLSGKETEVAALLMRAYTNRQLAQSLSMAPDTVKWHLKNIFGKLGVSNRTEAVLKLKEIGVEAQPERVTS
jgi:LuxR family transcriptional regulator, maltose regulon positive regulatory protein